MNSRSNIEDKKQCRIEDMDNKIIRVATKNKYKLQTTDKNKIK